MKLEELLNQIVTKVDGMFSIRSADIYCKEKGISIDIWWSEPHWNLYWYPIIHGYDNDGNTIFHYEGGENSNYWLPWMKEKLRDYLTDIFYEYED